MFEKELQKLKREELLQIMLAQSREIDSLTEQLEQEKAKNVNDEAESGIESGGDSGLSADGSALAEEAALADGGIPAEEAALADGGVLAEEAALADGGVLAKGAALADGSALAEEGALTDGGIPAEEGAGTGLPSTSVLENALKRVSYDSRFRASIVSTLMTLVVVAAAAVLIAVLVLPILRIYGQSMSETLDNGDIVVSVKTADLETGDIVAFYYNNTILVKRVIGQSGDWIDIAKDGTVSVNQQELEEPYLDKKAYGEIDIKLPYQVPEGRIFVMGDNREISIDSRTMMIGCVAEEQIVGKIIYRVWPFSKIGGIY